MSQEHRFSSQDPEFALLGMAQMLTGVDYPNNPVGVGAAEAMLKAQHAIVMPPVRSRATLLHLVAQRDPIIQMSEHKATLSLEADDYETALQAANHLHAYGDIDYKDSLGGEVFDLSLRTHRTFAEKIRGRFSANDPYLRFAGRQIFMEIEELRRLGNQPQELILLRGIVHTVALNGTLGEKAKRQFDPYALVEIK